MEPTGFWYSFGHLMYKYFHGMEWIYDHASPNKICIVLAFVCFAWWMKMQANFNKKAIKEGGYK
ncbi:MAG: hypothetical protein NT084_03575 [Bacteroidetes bacterium]|jgi:hypothetical protein|nr:hypothetical protein [Bacteroidota bacterium]